MIPAIPVPAFRDNYIWLLPLAGGAGQDARVAVVDPGAAAPVLAVLERLGLEAVAILVTHHHPDHIDGIPELLRHRRIPVYGPAGGPTPMVDHPLREGDSVRLGALDLRVIAVPGHTLDHIAYYAPGTLLCGDTLYSAGCGRLFEGTPAQMYESLRKISLLPDNTEFFCAHEYTEANLGFALAVEPGNHALHTRLAEVRRLRAEGRPSLPSSLALERRTNPFLRCGEPEVAAAAARRAGKPLREELEVFTVLRGWKDVF